MKNQKFLEPTSLPEALEYWSEINPQKNALIWGDFRFSYSELNQKVKQFSNALDKLDINPGHVVCSLLPKVPEFVMSFLGTIRRGAIYAPANSFAKDHVLELTITSISPELIILLQQDFEKIYQITKKTGVNCKFIILESEDNTKVPNIYLWKEIMKNGDNDLDFKEPNLDDVVYLNFTSGTTGNPKSAMTSHNNIYWNATSIISEMRLNEDDIHLCTFPVFLHPHEIIARPIYLGGTIVLSEASLDSIFDNIFKHSVTVMMSNPSIYQLFIQYIQQRGVKNIMLRIAESGGSITPYGLIKDYKEQLGVKIVPVWGSTETTGVAVILMDDYPDMKNEMCLGKPCVNYDIKIVDDGGVSIPNGGVGELIIKGPGVVSGYWGVNDENSRFNEGWYYTQDLIISSSTRLLLFRGRKNEMIKTNGLKVYPAEVERVLISNVNISAVCVVGVEDISRGEVLKAVIVLKKGAKLTTRDIVKYCQERLESHKIPRQVIIVDEIPIGINGKINKKVIMELQ